MCSGVAKVPRITSFDQGMAPARGGQREQEAPWPAIVALTATCADEGFTLRERLAIYPEYARTEFLDSALTAPVDALMSTITEEAHAQAAC